MDTLVTVKKFGSRMEADLAKSYLESEGIASFISADDVGGVLPPTIADAIELKVSLNDQQKAEALLNTKK
jgi:hypothetical protein